MRAALARALDRDRFIEIGNLVFGVAVLRLDQSGTGLDVRPDHCREERPALSTPTPPRELLAKAGFSDGEGMQPLVLTTIADERCRGPVLADIMRRELGVEIQLDPGDVTILGDRRDRLDFDLIIQNSGGDLRSRRRAG